MQATPPERAGAWPRRLLGLVACTLGGAVVGAIGWWATGAQAWWLAVPTAIAAGWWFVADPTQCDQPGNDHGPRER